jgi:hypothetical protein
VRQLCARTRPALKEIGLHLADAQQAWVETMAEIAAKENSADDGPVDERV